jgi:site-specific DNA-cytosine methylase
MDAADAAGGSKKQNVFDPTGPRLEERHRIFPRQQPPQPSAEALEWWAVEPDVGRVAHGVPSRVDRLRTLGNAVVPQVAEWIGRRILYAWKMTAK